MVVTTLKAQEFNDELKNKLRQSLIMPEQQPLHQKIQQPIQIVPEGQEVLKVSPTTKLPTKFDRIHILYDPKDYEVNINLSVTGGTGSQVERSMFDYSDGKMHPIPDARSVAQSAQYTRGDGGAGAGVGISGDFDPVRAVQSYKAKKRKEKVDRIKKAYGQ